MPDTIKIVEEQARSWAQEETLRRLVQENGVSNTYLEKLLESNFSKEQLSEAKKARAEFEKSLKTVGKDVKVLGKQYEKGLKYSFDEIKDSLKTSLLDASKALGTSTLRGDFGNLGSILGSTSHSLKNYSDMLENGAGKSLLRFGVAITGLSAAFAAGVKTMFEITNSFNQLYDVGTNFQDGLRGLTRFSYDLGLTVADTTKIMTEYSGVVSYLGTEKTKKLIQEFSKLTKTGSELGLNNTQMAEAILDYADMIRNSGLLATMDAPELAKNAKEFNLQLISAAEVTGKSRQQLEKDLKTRAQDAKTQMMLRALPEELRKRMQTSIMPQFEKMGAFGAKMSEQFAVAANYGIGAMEPMFQQMLAQAGISGEFMEMLERFKSGSNDMTSELYSMSSKLADPALSNEFGILAARAQGSTQALALMIAEAGSGAANLKNYVEELAKKDKAEWDNLSEDERRKTTFEDFQKKLDQKRNEERIARDQKENEARNKLTDASNKLKDLFDEFVLDVLEPSLPVLKLFAETLTGLMRVLKNIHDGLSSLFGWVFRGFNDANKIQKPGGKPGELIDKEDQELEYGKTAASLTMATVGLGGAWLAKKKFLAKQAAKAVEEAEEILPKVPKPPTGGPEVPKPPTTGSVPKAGSLSKLAGGALAIGKGAMIGGTISYELGQLATGTETGRSIGKWIGETIPYAKEMAEQMKTLRSHLGLSSTAVKSTTGTAEEITPSPANQTKIISETSNLFEILNVNKLQLEKLINIESILRTNVSTGTTPVFSNQDLTSYASYMPKPFATVNETNRTSKEPELSLNNNTLNLPENDQNKKISQFHDRSIAASYDTNSILKDMLSVLQELNQNVQYQTTELDRSISKSSGNLFS